MSKKNDNESIKNNKEKISGGYTPYYDLNGHRAYKFTDEEEQNLKDHNAKIDGKGYINTNPWGQTGFKKTLYLDGKYVGELEEHLKKAGFKRTP